MTIIFPISFSHCFTIVSILFSLLALSWLGQVSETYAAEKELSLARIAGEVRESEKKFITASFQIKKIVCDGDDSARGISAERRQVVQWWEWVQETVWSDSHDLSDSQIPLRITWCNKSVTSILEVPGELKRIKGWQIAGTSHFQPYALLLEALGFNGTLSEFLEGDPESLLPLTCDVSGEEECDGFRTAVIRGIRKFKDSDFHRETCIGVLLDHGCLPYWGRYREGPENDLRLMREAQVVSLFDFHDDIVLMREMKVVLHSDNNGAPGATSSVIMLDGSGGDEKPPEAIFTCPTPQTLADARVIPTSGNYVENMRSIASEELDSTWSEQCMKWNLLGVFVFGCIACIIRFSTLRNH